MKCSRKSCRELWDRFQKLKGNDNHADIVFILHPHELKIPAHKLILSLASTRFLREFSENHVKSTEKEVYQLTDIDPQLFDAFLTFIYTADVELCPEIAFGLIKLAKMYEMDELREICTNYILETLNECNIWTYFGHSVDMLDEDGGGLLRNKCLDFISNSNGGIFNQPSFLGVPRGGIKLLLALESIRVTESELLEVIIKWIDSHTADGQRQRRREHLGDLLHLIHFPTMSSTEFSRLVHKYPDILTDEEVREILLAISEVPNTPCTFPRHPRMRLPRILSNGSSHLRIVFQFNNISEALEKSQDLGITFKMQSKEETFVSGIGILVDHHFDQSIHGKICVQINTDCGWKDDSFPSIEGGHQLNHGNKYKLLFLVFEEIVKITPLMWYKITLSTNCDKVLRVEGKFCETVKMSETENVKFIRQHKSSSIPLILFK
ncbi:BTB/POZ domain-containing protein 2-like [Lutzomyia longipalpis]|uniref:BTB/POZ domain-containing protein 2-like n=1 Tax=Lutzomyia longipalpis TaxID=7200 RepID=UPI002483D271|nr:BTB/POZ domain-containing protein 2-like [Lutzomyia longipalpis]